MSEERRYLRYGPEVETPEPDEEATGEALAETMLSISRTTLKDGGHALRSVHAKSHGFLEAELVVEPGLPADLAQGLFATPGRHPVVMRLSTIPGDILDDSVSTPRGLALKVLDVDGERLDGSEGARTQDFVLVNGPAFGAPSAKQFLQVARLLAQTTDRAEWLKKAASGVLQNIQKVVVAFSGQPSPALATFGGQPETHILGETFYSQAPLRFGDHVAKISVAPVSPGLTALTGAPVDLSGAPNGLRAAVVAFFAENGAEWEIRAQLCTDLARMPVEDSSVAWPESESPYRTVGRIVAKPQVAWSEARAAAVDDGMAFSPWHGLAAHRPLGSIMRVRRQAYERSKRFRGDHTGHGMAEPAGTVRLPE